MSDVFLRPEVVRSYRQTRHLPAAAAVALLAAVARNGRDLNWSVADIGCGPGRFAAALPAVDSSFTCTAVDVSAAMLGEVRNRVRNDPRYRLLHIDASRDNLRAIRAHTIIAHWIANTTPRWQELLSSCSTISGSQQIVWFDERSPLYECVDGQADAASIPAYFGDLVRTFFRTFSHAPQLVQRRPGLHIHDTRLQTYVQTLGFPRVERLATVSWAGQISAAEFFAKILIPRAFTNLAALPGQRYDVALARAVKLLNRYPRDASRLFLLPYAATPIVATRA